MNDGVRNAWFGILPNGWQIRKAKSFFRERKEKGNDINLEILTPSQKYGVLPQSEYQNVTGSKPVQVNEDVDLKLFKTVHKNDFCISLSSYMGGFEFSEYEGVISPAYHSFYCFGKDYNLYFLKYLFKCSSFVDEVNRITPVSVRVGRNTSFDKFKDVFLPLPPLDIQNRIVSFLDKKTYLIDNEINGNKTIIKKLEEYKQSVISECVFGKSIKSKKVNNKTFGEIPDNWEVVNIKRFFNFKKGLSITKENLTETGVPVISYGQIHSKSNNGTDINDTLIRFVSEEYMETSPNCLVKKEDFIFADTSEDLEGTGNCIYINKDCILFAGYHTIILESKSNRCNRYFAYLFKTDIWRRQLRSSVYGVKLYSITQNLLKQTNLLIPEINEQKQIVEKLDYIIFNVDKIIEYRKGIIEKLEEYRKSLINEVITGKKEV